MALQIRSMFSALILSLVSLTSQAGSQANAPPNHAPEKIIQFAKDVEKSLAQRGARVAILARVGEPRSDLPKGIRYTHTALAVYSQIESTEGKKTRGYMIYNLYQTPGKDDRSELVRDFPVDFFAGVYDLKAGIIIPSSTLQQRLLSVINSHTYQKLHNPRYSLIANPFTLGYQNCTEHTLDVITSAIYRTDNIKQIKAYQKAHFKPQRVHISSTKLALGSMFVKSITTSDHPSRPVTATFSTIGDFLKENNAVKYVYHLSQ
ncbi:hypothetical protein CS022_01800 [Veronia nyctiphanis]|uniref:DUF2145 domain-containing protein n=1 Tax=Veronia nyctiphanis TaxID=1278244 RepID=A0A4Q0Z0J1_9GAMM|nr:DUF2145 domain-containing protein [Veronia nyctiphanis]RXJ74939.1 hypothetical protein CS022_01800 [Veronia nyctiphanis]